MRSNQLRCLAIGVMHWFISSFRIIFGVFTSLIGAAFFFLVTIIQAHYLWSSWPWFSVVKSILFLNLFISNFGVISGSLPGLLVKIANLVRVIVVNIYDILIWQRLCFSTKWHGAFHSFCQLWVQDNVLWKRTTLAWMYWCRL